MWSNSGTPAARPRTIPKLELLESRDLPSVTTPPPPAPPVGRVMADVGNLTLSVYQTMVDSITLTVTTASTLASKYAIAFSPILLETPVFGELDLATVSFALGILSVVPNANQTIKDAKAAGTDFALYVQGKGSLATVGADLGKISLDVAG